MTDKLFSLLPNPIQKHYSGDRKGRLNISEITVLHWRPSLIIIRYKSGKRDWWYELPTGWTIKDGPISH